MIRITNKTGKVCDTEVFHDGKMIEGIDKIVFKPLIPGKEIIAEVTLTVDQLDVLCIAEKPVGQGQVGHQPIETGDRERLEKHVLHLINFNNGEIRMLAVRYGADGFYCLFALIEPPTDETFERFDDLIGGDNDYFEATEYFAKDDGSLYVRECGDVSTRDDGFTILSMGKNPWDAYKYCMDKAIETIIKEGLVNET